ncbi:hypothetical protein EWB00_008302, partial [Schistosoma japonicum]
MIRNNKQNHLIYVLLFCINYECIDFSCFHFIYIVSTTRRCLFNACYRLLLNTKLKCSVCYLLATA